MDCGQYNSQYGNILASADYKICENYNNNKL
jgi:hypothetical protein